jgi:succinate dehydrogenase / fumarate reductase, membrane anchor subunit
MEKTKKLVSSLKKARGLGSAKSGTEHWLMQRLTAVAMLPLFVWLLVAVPGLNFEDVSAVNAWVAWPLNSFLLSLLLFSVFYHAYLGMTVVIEDYIHTEFTKQLLLISLRLGVFFFAAMGIFSVLLICFKA